MGRKVGRRGLRHLIRIQFTFNGEVLRRTLNLDGVAADGGEPEVRAPLLPLRSASASGSAASLAE